MHIAINGWFWGQTHTGSGQYLYHLLHALRRVDNGLKLTLILPQQHPEPTDLPADVQLLRAGRGLGGRQLGKVWFEQIGFPRAAERSGADLAHVPYWGPPLSASIPVVSSVLDVIPLIDPSYAMGVRNRAYLSLVSTAARNSTHIITISQTSKLDIENWLDIPSDRISVTYLAPEDRFHPQRGADKDAAVRSRYDLPDQFILYLGGFDKRKRLKDLLLAYTYIKDAEGAATPLVLAGREPEHWSAPVFPNIRRYAAELGISDELIWTGFIPEEDKPSLYRLARVFVFPSENEGFGLPPLEAMASGTPVVAADSVVNDEVLEDAAYLTDNPRTMAGALIALLLQEPFRASMINQGLALSTRYTWRKTARATLKVYEAVLRGQR